MSPATAAEHDAVHVYGIVLAGALDGFELPSGVGAVRSGPLAALVSSAATAGTRGLANAVRRHDAVLGGLVTSGVTVVPMRYGTTVMEPEAMPSRVLDAHRATLLEALAELDGLVQFTVRVDYVREAATRAALRDDPAIAALRERGSRDRSVQIRIGQRVVAAIDRRRAGDADRIRGELQPFVERMNCELSRDPERVADLACLVRRSEARTFEDAVEQLAERHHEAVRMTLVGPLAPYDFVPEL